ncbi:MAG: hypothetical protein JXR66_01705 [Bacteroidales bacterium]|nr:hypothetical protein [Bacteroidales bacterium]
MASLIPEYNYDIFISYRQKDNKGDRWVSKFVESLKTELEATFKEDVSVYFDENPHDRLQETHDVEKSLEGKLKCLIFIPILSQTYCDPNSYAWQYEFLTFLQMVTNDLLGRDVKLKSGNVASRILPIRIHDLDPEDIKLFETETGGILRAVDFVFRTSSGVNRPLMPIEDHPNDNLNKTFYRDQINKVANAIKEIISSISPDTIPSLTGPVDILRTLEESGSGFGTSQAKQKKQASQKIFTAALAAAVLILILVFTVFPDIFKTGWNKIIEDPDGKISIAVNDFENNSNDTTLDWLEVGIPELLRNNLANSNELSVQNSRTMNEIYESIRQTKNLTLVPSSSREAAIRLRAGNYITGSFQKYGDKILALVKLIDTKSDALLWTGSSEGDVNSIKYIADTLSDGLSNFLEIKALKNKTRNEYGDAISSSSEAYRKYIEGMQSIVKSDYKSALSLFLDACKLDSTSVLASFYIALAYDGLAVHEDLKYRKQAALWTQKAYDARDKLSGDYLLWIEMWHAYYNTKNTEDVLKYCDLLEESDIRSRSFWLDIGMTYMIFNKPAKALKMFERIEKISSEWDEDWKNSGYYYHYANCCNSLNLFDKAEEILRQGLLLCPESASLEYLQIRNTIQKSDSVMAGELIAKYLINPERENWSEGVKERWLGNLYANAKNPERGEEILRNAIKLDPGSDAGKYYLARLLINNDRNIDEGMQLLTSIQEKNPDVWNYDFFFLKSVGLFKQGKFASADSLLTMIRDSTFTASLEIDQLTKKVNDSMNLR